MIDINNFPIPTPGPAWNKKEWVNYMCIVDRMADRELTKLLLGESQTFQNEFTNYMSLSPEQQREMDLQEEIERQDQEKVFSKWFLLQIKNRFPDELERTQAECVGLEKWSDVTELLNIKLLELMGTLVLKTSETIWHKAFMKKYPDAQYLGGDQYFVKERTIILYPVLSEDLTADTIIFHEPDNYINRWVCIYTYSVKLNDVKYLGWYQIKYVSSEASYLIIPVSELVVP